jgi:tRNA threonylcarbamoyl adenosine modification protein YeaZ
MILAFNTSLADLHIGLFSDDAISLTEFHYISTPGERHIHDALLAQSTSDLLKNISASANDISRIAFINGPGSFTGLRIGLAFAKGVAFGSGATLIPLIAHTVLMRSYISQFNIHNARLPILYPGYAKDFFYVSYSDKPESITYMPAAELVKTGITDCICPPELDGIEIPHHSVSPDLRIMAEMAISRTDFNPPNYLADLEPFYGTDFKPTV